MPQFMLFLRVCLFLAPYEAQGGEKPKADKPAARMIFLLDSQEGGPCVATLRDGAVHKLTGPLPYRFQHGVRHLPR